MQWMRLLPSSNWKHWGRSSAKGIYCLCSGRSASSVFHLQWFCWVRRRVQLLQEIWYRQRLVPRLRSSAAKTKLWQLGALATVWRCPEAEFSGLCKELAALQKAPTPREEDLKARSRLLAFWALELVSRCEIRCSFRFPRPFSRSSTRMIATSWVAWRTEGTNTVTSSVFRVEFPCSGMQEFNWAYATLQRKVQATPAESCCDCRDSETVVARKPLLQRSRRLKNKLLWRKLRRWWVLVLLRPLGFICRFHCRPS